MTRDVGLAEELVRAGVMLAGEGLHPSSKGARVVYSGGKQTVVEGPFAETKELVAGVWILQCSSLQECIEWMKRAPNPHNDDGVIEIRQIFELGEFEMNAENQKRFDGLKATLEK